MPFCPPNMIQTRDTDQKAESNLLRICLDTQKVDENVASKNVKKIVQEFVVETKQRKRHSSEEEPKWKRFKIKTESIDDIKEEWQIDVKKENEINDKTMGNFAPEDLNSG